jgi:predicted branched-subunit amino acid permease
VSTRPQAGRAGLAQGVRAGVPYAIASGMVGVSFGVLARPVMGSVPAIVMSVIVFAGSAQFAALAVLSAGGGALPAIVAGVLLNLRFVPMGIAIAPWLPHGSLGRALRGQALIDASWALANRGGGRFDTQFLTPLAPAGVSIIAASLAVVAGLRRVTPSGLDVDRQ